MNDYTNKDMSIPYRIKDGYYGESIVSDIPLENTPDGTRILRISTSKNSNVKAQIYSKAMVHIEKKENGYNSECFVIFQDYNKTISRDICNRVTENALLKLHNEALKKLPDIILEVKQFYIDLDNKVV